MIEPAWLWPHPTMRPEREEMPVNDVRRVLSHYGLPAERTLMSTVPARP